MRKITAGLFVSLDGVAEAPDGWHFPFLTEEWQRLIGAPRRSSPSSRAR